MIVSLCEINTFEQALPLCQLEGFVQTTTTTPTWICRLRRLHCRGLQARHCVSAKDVLKDAGAIYKHLRITRQYMQRFE